MPIKKSGSPSATLADERIIVSVREPSTWISTLLVVTKANGDIRICIDPKPLNKALFRDHYPMPTMTCYTTCKREGLFHGAYRPPGSHAPTWHGNILARFTLAFSDVVAPIQEILRRDVEFRWDKAKHGDVLSKLKYLLTLAPVLSYYDVRNEMTVQCDSSHPDWDAVFYKTADPLNSLQEL